MNNNTVIATQFIVSYKRNFFLFLIYTILGLNAFIKCNIIITETLHYFFSLVFDAKIILKIVFAHTFNLLLVFL